MEPYPGRTNAPWKVQCECGHIWKTTPNNLFKYKKLPKRGRGCRKCWDKVRGLNRKLSSKEALRRFEAIHHGKIIPLEPYTWAESPWKVQCECGHVWAPTAISLFTGRGCRKCTNKSTGEKQRLSPEEAVARLAAKHQGRIIHLEPYTGSQQSWKVQCECGHIWEPLGGNLFAGYGCPKCADCGFQPDQPAITCYVRVANPFGDPVYKIGITNRTVAERFCRDLAKITLLKTWPFQKGADAYEMEQRILAEQAEARYFGPELLRDGNDELFIFDVFGLDDGRDSQLELEFAQVTI